jgi:hypothetical protein
MEIVTFKNFLDVCKYKGLNTFENSYFDYEGNTFLILGDTFRLWLYLVDEKGNATGNGMKITEDQVFEMSSGVCSNVTDIEHVIFVRESINLFRDRFSNYNGSIIKNFLLYMIKNK